MESRKRSRQFHLEWIWAILPVFLGLSIVVVFSAIELIEFHFSSSDIDTFILLFSLLITTGIASTLISRESVRRMQQVTEKQLRQQYAEDRARFLSRLDHEIKNPLMGIKTALDNLADTDAPEDRSRIRSAINGQLDRLTRLVTDLRKIGDLDQKQIEYFPIDTRMLIEDAFNFAVEDDRAKLRETILDLPDELPYIRGDYDLLMLSIYNVLNNALKYTRDSDTIQLSVTMTEEDITIAIRDTGPGISPTDLEHIGEELYRSQTVKHIPGNGIGLSLVKRIIERHGGTIDFISQLGDGTTVQMTLPYFVSE